MACVAPEINTASKTSRGQERHEVPVIADRGDGASVVVVCFNRQPRLGDRFEFEGLTWEIVRTKDMVRGYVARPLQPPA
jgi:hypothetical protein